MKPSPCKLVNENDMMLRCLSALLGLLNQMFSLFINGRNLIKNINDQL